jgi:hypothetical protein
MDRHESVSGVSSMFGKELRSSKGEKIIEAK